MNDEPIAYRAGQYWCGALGRWSRERLERLRRDAPDGLSTAVEGPTAVLCTTGTTDSWSSGSRRGRYWDPFASGSEPTRWQDAAESRLAAGLQTEPVAALHTDALGLHDLYYREIDGAVYFASRIEGLLDLGDAPLHIGWDAWAAILAFHAPAADDTPFREIRRLRAATALAVDDGRLSRDSFEPGWLQETEDAKTTPTDVVDTVTEAIVPASEAAMTLSGGWDSRLLGILARRRIGAITAWTTSGDDGHDRDVAYAGPVAEALGMEHRTLIPGPEAWVEEHAAVRERLEFQTHLHTWIMPVARSLHDRERTVIDGLAGDILFKSALVGKSLATETDARRREHRLWKTLEQRRLRANRMLRPAVADLFTETTGDRLHAAVAPFIGHRAGAMLGVLHLRTARAIGLSGRWLLGPELDVRTPFAHPEVLRAAIRVPAEEKLGGAFYRRMLHTADPHVAALPSTNDGRPLGARRGRRQASPESLRILGRHVREAEPIMALLTPTARRAVKDPDALALLGSGMGGMRTLAWAGLFGNWLERHRARLAIDGCGA
ncbi:asparagine synthase-related protein [Glycomyces xiaoerkulensis]|uniref:asparagine synthase-related protein n=1 Tax=Glycomyces xiaoerkulensis TaxID=2038139 RepID=UPI000C259761|nr:asparagine synthetase B family protein [Glycomyces xiaoerkulensis]